MDCSESFLFVIHDDPVIRDSEASLASLMGVQAKLFFSAEEFLDRFEPSLAGCLLTDFRLQKMGGLELQEALVARGSILPIVFVSQFGNVAMAVRAMKNGALTVMERPYRTDELIGVIHYGMQVSRKALEVVANRTKVRRRLESLSVQERRLLEMIIEGTPNKRITRVFGVSQRTVARLRAKVYEKMGVDSAFELARVIAKSGALSVDDGHEQFSMHGREFRTHAPGSCLRGVASGSGGRQAIILPPHFEQGERCVSSG